MMAKLYFPSKKIKVNGRQQQSLWESERASMGAAIELSIASLKAYAELYPHWGIAYSGGKDSSATTSFVLWAIQNGLVKRPESLTVLYADTRQELPALFDTATRFLAEIRALGFEAKAVLPKLDHRFYVYILGRGVAPPSNHFRWCTQKLKLDPMLAELERLHTNEGKRFIQLTGVRQGESASRDAKIAISCTSNGGECGQGWFQAMGSQALTATLAPLLHWRACWVWDWLYFWHSDKWAAVCGYERGHGFAYLSDIAAAYGDNEENRTGCVGCPLVSKDRALEAMVKVKPELAPLLEIRPLLDELKSYKWRLRKVAEKKKDGTTLARPQRIGPLTMAGRAYGLERILDIQHRAGVDLVNEIEQTRIRELWDLNTWPEHWEGGLDDPENIMADALIPVVSGRGTKVIEQLVLVSS